MTVFTRPLGLVRKGAEGAVAQPALAWMVMGCEFSRLCEADKKESNDSFTLSSVWSRTYLRLKAEL